MLVNYPFEGGFVAKLSPMWGGVAKLSPQVNYPLVLRVITIPTTCEGFMNDDEDLVPIPDELKGPFQTKQYASAAVMLYSKRLGADSKTGSGNAKKTSYKCIHSRCSVRVLFLFLFTFAADLLW